MEQSWLSININSYNQMNPILKELIVSTKKIIKILLITNIVILNINHHQTTTPA